MTTPSPDKDGAAPRPTASFASNAHKDGIKCVWVVGAGRMGRAVAAELLLQPSLRVLLIDPSPHALSEAVTDLQQRSHQASDRIGTSQSNAVDVADDGCSGIVLCAPWSVTLASLKHLLGTSGDTPVVSITRPVYSDIAELSAAAVSARRAVYLPFGLEPGLVEMIARAVCRSTPEIVSLVIGCGGVPRVPMPPLYHRMMFGDRIPVDDRDAWLVRSGVASVTARFADPRPVVVPGVGMLESYHDGMMPSTAHAREFLRLSQFEQRTLRWPGFATRMLTLREMGLFSEQPIVIGKTVLRPSDMTQQILARTTATGDAAGDIGIVHVQAVVRDGCVSTASLTWSGTKTATGIALATAVTAVAALEAHVPGRTGLHWPTCADLAVDVATVLQRLKDRTAVDLQAHGTLQHLLRAPERLSA
jgi:lysine 6-dehydrogenase